MHGSTIIHIPHSSTLIPDSIRPQFGLSTADIDRELLLMTDRYTDEMFAIEGDNIQRLVSPVSRLVVDPERFRNDADEPMAERGMGAVYMKTAHGEALRRILEPDEREQLLVEYYDPHHTALTRMVGEALDQHGSCLIIDAHSFPSTPLLCDLSQEQPRPDICLGTDSFHTPKKLVEFAENILLSHGWTVGIDWPYTGAIVPLDYYGKDLRVQAIMVEVNRGLYMDEETGEKLEGFDEIRAKLQNCLTRIVSVSDLLR